MAGARTAVKKKKKKTTTPKRVLISVLTGLYILLFIVALVIVVLFIVYKTSVKPPDVDEAVQVTLPAAPTDGGTDSGGQEQPPGQEQEVIRLQRREDFYTFLLVGTDDGNGNADTIMVGAFDAANHKVSVLSIPRDTLVDVSRSVKKINGAYGQGGVEQLLDELEPILGFRPDHYVLVDIQAFVEVVDILGGVSFYVPEDMHHNDGAGFVIDLEKGTQYLNGEQALQLVRYRGYQNADLGRIQTQQKFLKELARQAVSWQTVPKIGELAQTLIRYIDTDLSVTELTWFGTQALGLDFSADVSFATLPGDGSASYKGVNWYYELYPDECRELINTTVNPYTTDIPEALFNIFQVP